MADTRAARSIAVQVVRWTARVIGSLAAAYWLFVGAASLTAGEEPWTWQSTVIAVLIVASALSVAAAWRWEGIGGALVLVCAIAFGAFAAITARHSMGLAMLLAGGPFLVAGVLFAAGWWGLWRGSKPAS